MALISDKVGFLTQIVKLEETTQQFSIMNERKLTSRESKSKLLAHIFKSKKNAEPLTAF